MTDIVFIGRRGRRPRGDGPTVVVTLRLTPAERDRMKQAARTNAQSVSSFARDALVTAADDCLEEPFRNTN